MITLKISFLLAINLEKKIIVKTKKHTPRHKGKKRKKDKSIKSKSKAKRKKKKSKKKEKNQKLKQEEDVNYSTIEVQDPIIYVHIEYELFPKKYKYDVDVICWGPVAKIYTKNGTKSVKTAIRGKIAWVPVSIEHYLNPLPTEEIRKLLKQVITGYVKVGKNHIGAKAKSEKASIFYQHVDDANNECFPEVFTEKPKTEKQFEVDRIFKKLLTFPIKREIVTWMYNTDEVHACKIAKIVTKKTRGEEIYCKDFYEEDKTESKKKIGKKNKKRSKSKSVKSTKKSKKSRSTKTAKSKKSGESQKMDFKIPAQVLLSDPMSATFQIKNTNTSLEEIYILLSSNDILTFEQKKELCPLVVKIRKINNLPEEVLRRNGFSQTFASCNIPGIAEFKTSLRPVGTTVRFDESRFIITSETPKIKILEILQTRRAFVKIMGVKELPKRNGSPVKTSKKKSKKSKKSKRASTGDTKSAQSTILALATFDLSPLAKTHFLFKEKGQCHTLNPLVPKEEPPMDTDQYFIDRFTTNEINLWVHKFDPTPLKDPILFSNGTTLKFEAHFLVPEYPLFYIRDASATYKRLLLVLLKTDVAEVLLSSVILHNSEILNGGSLVLPNFLNIQKIFTDDNIPEDRNNLSGFMVDDGNCFIFFLEGPSNGFILKIIHQVTNFNYSTGKVFYNSDYLFEERLCKSFLKYSGFLIITLKLPLMDILSQAGIYVEGNLPGPCLTGLQKLNLILNSTTVKTILNHDLVPTEMELLSFSLEFGLPVRYKTDEIVLNGSGEGIFSSDTNVFGHKRQI